MKNLTIQSKKTYNLCNVFYLCNVFLNVETKSVIKVSNPRLMVPCTEGFLD